MNYIVNDSKTQAEKVTSALQAYQSEEQEKSMIENAKQDHYLNTIDRPRMERQLMYQDYVDQKKVLRDTYMQTLNLGKLREWLSHPMPQEIVNGVHEPYIYTKNVVVK
jgi:hypothetical protein